MPVPLHPNLVLRPSSPYCLSVLRVCCPGVTTWQDIQSTVSPGGTFNAPPGSVLVPAALRPQSSTLKSRRDNSQSGESETKSRIESSIWVSPYYLTPTRDATARRTRGKKTCGNMQLLEAWHHHLYYYYYYFRRIASLASFRYCRSLHVSRWAFFLLLHSMILCCLRIGLHLSFYAQLPPVFPTSFLHLFSFLSPSPSPLDSGLNWPVTVSKSVCSLY